MKHINELEQQQQLLVLVNMLPRDLRVTNKSTPLRIFIYWTHVNVRLEWTIERSAQIHREIRS